MAQTLRILSLDRRRFAAIAFVSLMTIAPRAASGQGACIGDCNLDGVVVVNELITMVNILLDRVAVTACPPGDQNGDGKIVVNEVVGGVGSLLRGCVPTPTPTATPTGPTLTPTSTPSPTTTPTPTATGPTATPTATPRATATATVTRTAIGPTPTSTAVGPTSTSTSAPTATRTQPPTATATTGMPTPQTGAVGIASRLPMVLRAVTVFPIVSTVMSRGGLNGGPAAGAGLGEPGSCPLGGTAQVDDAPPPPDVRVWTASNCKLSAYGGTLTVNGTIRIFVAAPSGSRYDINVTGTYADSEGDTVLMGEVDLGGVEMGPVPGGQCRTRGITVDADEGHVRATTPDGRWAEIGFVDTMVGFGLSPDANCVPITYGVGLTGPGTVSSSEGGFAEVTFNMLNISADDSTSVTRLTLFGRFGGPCTGGDAQITQPVTAELGWTSICPSAGETLIDFGQDRRSYVTYTPNLVEFDIGFDNIDDISATSCLDTRFLECP